MKRTIWLSLVVLFVSLPSVVFAQPPLGSVPSGETSQAASTAETTAKDDFAKAEVDARRDAELAISSGSWFAFGFFCGGIGVISAFLSSPSPDATRLVGKSPAYVGAYARVYESVAKERRLKSSVVGCLATSVLSTLYWATR